MKTSEKVFKINQSSIMLMRQNDVLPYQVRVPRTANGIIELYKNIAYGTGTATLAQIEAYRIHVVRLESKGVHDFMTCGTPHDNSGMLKKLSISESVLCLELLGTINYSGIVQGEGIEAVLKALFYSDFISDELRFVLSYEYHDYWYVSYWFVLNADEKQVSELATHSKTIPQVMAAIEHTTTWQTVYGLLSEIKQDKSKIANIFVKNLNESIITKGFVKAMMLQRKEAGISLNIAARHARKIYDFDESVPNEWIERAFL